jgi:hypothetical protein
MIQTRPIRYPWPGRGLVAAALRFRMFCPAVRDLPPAGLSIRVSSAAGRACYAPASLSLVLRRGREQAADDLVEAGLDAPPVMAVVVEEGGSIVPCSPSRRNRISTSGSVVAAGLVTLVPAARDQRLPNRRAAALP